MPIRGIILPVERNYYGFCDRLGNSMYFSKITRLQDAGLSAHDVATELNRQRWPNDNNVWDTKKVMGVIWVEADIRRNDLIWRLERTLRV